MQRRPEAERSFECATASGKQDIPGIALARRSAALHPGDGTMRNLELRMLRATRELLDRPPIAIPRRKIRLSKARVLTQYRVHETDAFNQIGPVDGGNRAHTGNDVA